METEFVLCSVGTEFFRRVYKIAKSEYLLHHFRLPAPSLSLSRSRALSLSLSRGTLLGNLEGVCLPGIFLEKKKYIWVPFLEPEDIKILSLGAIGNFSKGTGLS